MHMNDSLGRSGMTPVAMLFEQGAAIAAEGYARSRDGYGCCLVTSGPGATNAVTGCVGAFIDSIPVIFPLRTGETRRPPGKFGRPAVRHPGSRHHLNR